MKNLIKTCLFVFLFSATYLNQAAAVVACDRTCLSGFMDTFLEALVKHDPANLPVTRNVKYTENGVRLNLGDGLWQTAFAKPTYRVDVIDEIAGTVGLLGTWFLNASNRASARRRGSQSAAPSELAALRPSSKS